MRAPFYPSRWGTLAAIYVSVSFAGAAFAQSGSSETLDRLFSELSKPDQPGWESIENDIQREWAKSGSPAMDLLLERGADAIAADDLEAAIEHLTALVDHAPEFAEGWNARATAYFRAELYGPAIEDIRRVLELNPRHFGALTGLGIIFEGLGMEAEALEILRQVQEIHPHRPNVNEAVERLTHSVDGKEI